MNRPVAEIWAGRVKGAGIYADIPEARYHEDPCPDPSLSASVAKIAFFKSVRKAKAAHPRLRDAPVLDADEDDGPASPWYMEVGRAVHSLALGVGAEPVEIAVKDFRTKDARALRDAATAGGKIPLITKHYDLAHRMAPIARAALENLLGANFLAETMVVSQESGVWRRSLFDGLAPDLTVWADLKTTSRDMSPAMAARSVNLNGNQFQDAFYRRNLDNIDPAGMARRRSHFVFQEIEYPHEIAIVHCDEAMRSKGDLEVEGACRLWDRAMRTGVWPGYSQESLGVAPFPQSLIELELRMAMDESLQEDAA